MCGCGPAHDTRVSARERGYTTAWDRVSAHYRRVHPLCEVCAARGVVRPATLVHHLDPVVQGGAVLTDESRLVSVCRDCHPRIEADPALAPSSSP